MVWKGRGGEHTGMATCSPSICRYAMPTKCAGTRTTAREYRIPATLGVCLYQGEVIIADNKIGGNQSATIAHRIYISGTFGRRMRKEGHYMINHIIHPVIFMVCNVMRESMLFFWMKWKWREICACGYSRGRKLRKYSLYYPPKSGNFVIIMTKIAAGEKVPYIW